MASKWLKPKPKMKRLSPQTPQLLKNSLTRVPIARCASEKTREFLFSPVTQIFLISTTGNIIQILRKLPLSTHDDFMFNDARSGLSKTQCYDVLENIKNCRSSASSTQVR